MISEFERKRPLGYFEVSRYICWNPMNLIGVTFNENLADQLAPVVDVRVQSRIGGLFGFIPRNGTWIEPDFRTDGLSKFMTDVVSMVQEMHKKERRNVAIQARMD